MKKKANKPSDIETWASSTDLSVEQVKAACEELRRRRLLSMKRDKVEVSPLAMRRSVSDAERRLAAHLAGYLLTENSFIVRRAGNPPGLPSILDTRITVEQIANYFKEGCGVTEIESDLDLLTRPEIEAAIQYYLNHREEIERDMRRSQELYEKHAPRRDTVPA
jgi:uncharacterized protein (DUF433 family)